MLDDSRACQMKKSVEERIVSRGRGYLVQLTLLVSAAFWPSQRNCLAIVDQRPISAKTDLVAIPVLDAEMLLVS